VQEGAAGGAITSAGVYTAPATAGNYHVVATSQADSTKSATATVTVTAPAPIFNSTPVTAANEGDLYTYTAVATDPANGSVRYQLTTAPAGATILNGVISWTPTQAQARTPNSFVVTATTDGGGSATQRWSVTPSGNIRGTRIVTYFTESGQIQVPHDLTGDLIYALVLDGKGGYVVLAGSGTADGTFTIPHVPGGYYWFGYNYDSFWTGSSIIDLGYDAAGRGYLDSSAGTTLLLRMSNLSPWQAQDEYQTIIPNVDYVNSWLLTDSSVLGHTSIDVSTPWDGAPLLDASRHDTTYITQMIDYPLGSDVFRYAGKSSGPLDITLTDGATTNVLVPLGDVFLDRTFHVAIEGPAFEEWRTSVNPDAVTSSSQLNLDVHPFGLSRGLIGNTANLLVYMPRAPITTDQVLGNFVYGNPYPSTWPEVVRYWQTFSVPYTAPGATNALDFSVNFYQESTAVGSGNAIQPAISPVTSATINGMDFFQAQTILTPEVTIAWQPPYIGTPSGYRIHLYKIYASGRDSMVQDWAKYYTRQTSAVIPADSFEPGYSFIIRITAASEANVDYARAPYRISTPYAHAETVSGLIAFPAR
jgi:hypothetical protein